MRFGQQTGMRLGLILLGVGLCGGFYSVLEKRFTEGGLYPHYASFRSDPLGTSAFYESLEGLGVYQVSRNIEPLNTVKGLGEGTTLLLLGYPREGLDSLRAPENSAVTKAVEAGARLVITMNPELVPEAFQPKRSGEEDEWIDRRRRISEERLRERKSKNKAARPEEEGKEIDEEQEEKRLANEMEEALGPLFTKKMGFEISSPEGFQRPAGGWKTRSGRSAITRRVPSALPSWRSQYRFTGLDDSWKSVVLVRKEPVVIERKLGEGSIVLATDSYFVSNESLHSGGNPEFLLWLMGDKERIVFDETIHGVEETGGAMKLIRRYRGHGVFFGLLVFLALWAWRSASSLVPGSEEQDRGIVASGGSVTGEATGSGLIRLLRKSVPTTGLLRQCVEVWDSSRNKEVSSGIREKMKEVLARHGEDPRSFGVVAAYGAIADLLRKR